jgi:ubiquinone/menaquinone biosynthesis C-methylase UbiE
MKSAENIDFQTQLAWLSLGKQQTHAPIGKLHRALDVGCGTGLWAIDFCNTDRVQLQKRS